MKLSEMNIGDKIICKKDFGFFKKNQVCYLYEKPAQLSDPSRYIVKICNFYIDINHYDFFYTNKGSDKYLWDFFYSDAEIRKLKIQRLNKNESI